MPDILDLDPHTRALWDARETIRRQIGELAERQNVIDEMLRERCAAHGRYGADGRTLFRVEPNRRFDPHAAARLVPSDVLADCITRQPEAPQYDPKLLKRHLTAAQLDACMVEQGRDKMVPA